MEKVLRKGWRRTDQDSVTDKGALVRVVSEQLANVRIKKGGLTNEARRLWPRVSTQRVMVEGHQKSRLSTIKK